jgi:hypothetical protein
MKKLLFTALAVVAFSGVSVAGTKEIKVVEQKVLFTDCVAVAIVATETADPESEWTAAQTNAFYQGIYDACQTSQPKDKVLTPI